MPFLPASPGCAPHCVDRDPEAIKSAAAITDPAFDRARAFRMKEQLAALGISQVNGILMDIGVSSPQIDEVDRGFSFRMDGPLDMRMDTTCGLNGGTVACPSF